MCYNLDLSTSPGNTDPKSPLVGWKCSVANTEAQVQSSQLLAKNKSIVCSYCFNTWYIFTLKILHQMDMKGWGRHNSTNLYCNISRYHGHIVTTCQDEISAHKSTMYVLIFFVGEISIHSASTDLSVWAISGHTTTTTQHSVGWCYNSCSRLNCALEWTGPE